MLERRRPERHMAEFAAGAWLFAVEMKMGRWNGQHLRGFGDFADEVDHRGSANHSRGTQREAADGTKMVFKLARHRAFDRPMPRVMDARSHFIRQQLAIALKEFDGQNTDVIQRLEHLARRVLRSFLNLRRDARSRSQGKPQNAASMMVFDQRIEGGFACLAANGNYGELSSKWNKALDNNRQPGQSLLRDLHLFR